MCFDLDQFNAVADSIVSDFLDGHPLHKIADAFHVTVPALIQFLYSDRARIQIEQFEHLMITQSRIAALSARGAAIRALQSTCVGQAPTSERRLAATQILRQNAHSQPTQPARSSAQTRAAIQAPAQAPTHTTANTPQTRQAQQKTAASSSQPAHANGPSEAKLDSGPNHPTVHRAADTFQSRDPEPHTLESVSPPSKHAEAALPGVPALSTA